MKSLYHQQNVLKVSKIKEVIKRNDSFQSVLSLNILIILSIYYIIDAFTCKKHSNVAFDPGGANFNYYIHCWVAKSIKMHHFFIY